MATCRSHEAAGRRRFRRAWLALGTALALGGCASLPAPDPDAPPPAPASLPSTWQTPMPHHGSTSALIDWWAGFGDPLVPELIGAAQAASPTLAIARSRIARARAVLVAADAAALPRADATAEVLRGRSIPGAPISSAATLGAQASWELDVAGGVAAGRRAATERLRGAEAGWHDARIAVAADVADALLALRACEIQLALTEADARSRSETARLTDASARAGFTAPADAALARAGAAQARSLARAQQARCDVLVKSLVELTDLAEPALRERLAAGRARLLQPPAISPGVLPGELLTQRPDVAVAAAEVAAAAADIRCARADEGLRVTIAGSLAGGRVHVGGSSGHATVWSLGPLQVSFPLFDGGARRAASAAAVAAYDEAVALYQAAARRAWREVEAALVGLDASAARERDVRAAAADFEASLNAIAARQRGGLASMLDLEVARRNALQAQGALVEFERERAAASIALYRSLGGGWPATVPDTASAASTR